MLPDARVCQALSRVVWTRNAHLTPFSATAAVSLSWDGLDTALVELDDLSTFNAMSQGLLKALSTQLSNAFASSAIHALIL